MPGLVWALDDTELARGNGQLLRLHQVQDLASHYTFSPWVGERIVGELVAQRLEELFLRYGPPLVLKRDNGGNLNQHAVDVVLARYWVVPLNSPRQYPPYNGGMERAIREVKASLREKLRASGPLPPSEVQHWAELLAHDLNHRPRRSLHGQVACRVFQKRYRTPLALQVPEFVEAQKRFFAGPPRGDTARQRPGSLYRWADQRRISLASHVARILRSSPDGACAGC